MDKHKADRTGEIFQNMLTTNEDAPPPVREQASHDLQPDTDIDSQEADEKNPQFARELRKSGHASGH